jgi:gamma-glutamylcyclotransferase (GGCT)/AIG2-like uncharacterized protein YtfP
MRTAVPIASAIRNQSRSATATRRRSFATARKVDQKPLSTLFAYGTLRRGAPMHGLLEGRTTWLGPASAAGRLVDLGAFPGLVPAQGPGDRVHGDLFAISAAQHDELLDALDRYEGASFERLPQRVDGPDGPALAWVYAYRGDVDGRPVLASGDYLGR